MYIGVLHLPFRVSSPALSVMTTGAADELTWSFLCNYDPSTPGREKLSNYLLIVILLLLKYELS